MHANALAVPRVAALKLAALLLATLLPACGESTTAPQGRTIDGTLHVLQINRLQGLADGVPCNESIPIALIGAADLVAELEARGEPTALVCLGETFHRTAHQIMRKADHVAAVARADAIMAAMALAGVDLFVPGAVDLALGVDTLMQTAQRHGIRVLITNADTVGFEDTAVQHWILAGSDPDGPRMALLAVIPARHADTNRQLTGDVPEGLTVNNPLASLREVSARLLASGEADFVGVLSNVSQSTNNKIMDVDTVDFLFGCSDPTAEVRPLVFRNGTAYAMASALGKEVGHTTIRVADGNLAFEDLSHVMDLEDKIREDEAWLKTWVDWFGTDDIDSLAQAVAGDDLKGFHAFKDRAELIELNKAAVIETREWTDSSVDHRAVALEVAAPDHPVRRALLAMGPAMDAAAAAADLKPVDPTLSSPRIPHPDSCKECHAAQYAHWASTAHARAFGAMNARSRRLDSGCHECHSTGFGLTGGYDDVRHDDPFGGVSCLQCHKNVSTAHTESPRVVMQPMHAWVIDQDQECHTCHSERRSPGLDLFDQIAVIGCPPMELDTPELQAVRQGALDAVIKRRERGKDDDGDIFIAAYARIGLGNTEAIGDLIELAGRNNHMPLLSAQIARLLDRHGHSVGAIEVVRQQLAAQPGSEDINRIFASLLLFPSNEQARDPERALKQLRLILPEDMTQSEHSYVILRCLLVDALYMVGDAPAGFELLNQLIEQQGEDPRIRERVRRWVR